MSKQRLIIDCGSLSADGFKSVCNLAPGQLPALQNLANYIESIPDQQPAVLSIQVGAVSATATIVSTGTATAAQTMTLANQTLTAMASAADPALGQFNVSATPATQAASIALAINSMPALAGKVSAVANSGTVTVSSVVPGLIGNALQIVDVNLANVDVTAFANGSDGTSYTLNFV